MEKNKGFHKSLLTHNLSEILHLTTITIHKAASAHYTHRVYCPDPNAAIAATAARCAVSSSSLSLSGIKSTVTSITSRSSSSISSTSSSACGLKRVLQLQHVASVAPRAACTIMAHDQVAGPLKIEPSEAADNNDCGMLEQQLPPRSQQQQRHDEPGSFEAVRATAVVPMSTDEPEPATMPASEQPAVHPAAAEQHYHQHQHSASMAALAYGSHGSPHSTSAAATGLMGQQQAYFSAWGSLGADAAAPQHDSLASMDDADEFHPQAFVPRRDSSNNIPCFVQTSALFTNVCAPTPDQMA